jgi:hypothetical protein
MATVHVHPPLAVHLVAAVNVPAGVPWILYTGRGWAWTSIGDRSPPVKLRLIGQSELGHDRHHN